MADLNLRFLKAFPKNFTFGTATSSYQIEGGNLGDVGARIGMILLPRTYQGQDGAIACDHYHHWQEDIGLCAQDGFNAYRFSFSWARLLPEDNTQVNQQGLAFYDRLLDGLLA